MLGKACEIESDDITCAVQGRGPKITWFEDCLISNTILSHNLNFFLVDIL